MFDGSQHPSFLDQPAAEDALWRYMDLSRFLSLLEDEALHFARADQMSDRWEGSFGAMNTALRPRLYGDEWEKLSVQITGIREWSRQRTHMSCWHEAPGESAAMWELYQREGRGVAVRSTWGGLTGSLGSDRNIFGGRVNYVDYKSTFIPESNAFTPFMHKRHSYAHEKEVRLLMRTGFEGPPNESGTPTSPEGPTIPIPVDLQRLVDAIYIAPDAPVWFGDLISKVVRRYGHNFEVRQSDLNIDPID